MKRQFIKEEPVYQMTKKRGNIFAYELLGENGSKVYYQEKFQGPSHYNGQNFNQLIFSVTLEDLNFTTTSKTKDIFQDERLLCNYGLMCVEFCLFEELYKTALIITRKRAAERIKSFEAAKLKRQKTGQWEYDIYQAGGPMSCIRQNAQNKKILKTIDVTEANLEYFENYSSE